MMRSSTSSHISSGKNLLLLALVSVMALGTLACDDGSIETGQDPIFSSDPTTIEFDNVPIGEDAIETVWLENTGGSDLVLSDLRVHNDTGDALSPDGDWPAELVIAPDDRELLSVRFEPTEEADYGGSIEMTANTSNGSESVPINIGDFDAEIFVDPSSVDFPQTPAGIEEFQVARIHNVGDGTLHIDDIFVASGSDNFSISFVEGKAADGGFLPPDQDSDSHPTSLEPTEDDEVEPIYMRVTFSPEDESPKHGEVLIQSSDGDYTVNLSGNSGDACLQVSDGAGIDFGPASINNTTYMTITLQNCSPEADLELRDVSISDDGGGVFSLQPGSEPGTLPDEPFVLAPGDVTTTVIGYSPNEETDHVGELYIESDDSTRPDRYIPITGTGLDATCPVAQAAGNVGGGAPTNPIFATNQDLVNLTSEGSNDPDGTELDYEWSVIAHPDGSLSDLEPNPFVADPQFEVDIVGNFQIELVVYDEFGLRNCDPAIVEIDATPDEDIHVQLVWSAPEVDATYGGPNGDAGIGTDLDIHYVNTAGIDEWGASDSIYWNRPEQDWGTHGEARLDIDDLYGDNPENINHSDPGMNGMYRVGVHYFSDNSWGAANATVRIYFGVDLYGQWDERLEHTDYFWYVGNVVWSDNPYVDVIDSLQTSHSLPSASGF